ncbi:MAG: MFS transporter, partial [Chloroflexi bacterium]|nr:MFS transporter [Chloroflexota bacterium]
MLTWLTRDGKVLLLAKGLRTVVYGAFSVLLGIYLSLLGLDAWAVGLTLAAALAGDTLLTLGVTFVADRLGRRRTLVLLALVGAVGGFLFLSTEWGPLLAFFALLSGLSTTGKESGPFLTIEGGIFPQTCPPERRTLLFSLANLISEGGAALGALASAAPVVIAALLGLSPLASYRLLLGIAAGAGLAAAALYLLLSSGVELQAERQGRGLSPSTRGRVVRLGLLFAVDAAGGGVIVQSFLAYW